MRGMLRSSLSFFLFIVVTQAQDRRTVSEPRVPVIACATLTADLPSPIPDEAESRLDTVRIQKAIDGCKAGQKVLLEKGSFLSGPLKLRSGVTLVIDKGATLFASRNPRDYEIQPGSCGVVNKAGRGCRALITGEGVQNAAIMGGGTIDGRGREHLIGQKVSWWDLAQEAKVKNENQNCPRLIVVTQSEEFTLYNILLKNSPNFHVVFNGKGFTAWGVVINTPKTARNTDGIDPSSATDVTITHCSIHTGDDNVAIKAGSTGASSHMTIAHNHFYTGHGMSIGSETNGGASAIHVSDLSIDGADNGLRIKSNVSRGGLVEDIVYEDVCIRNTKNPIYMDSNYSFFGEKRDLPPLFRDIQFHHVHVEGAGKITLDGLDATHRLGMFFDDVTTDVVKTKFVTHHATVKVGPGPVNFVLSGEDVQMTGQGTGTSSSCGGKFVPMPSTAGPLEP